MRRTNLILHFMKYKAETALHKKTGTPGGPNPLQNPLADVLQPMGDGLSVGVSVCMCVCEDGDTWNINIPTRARVSFCLFSWMNGSAMQLCNASLCTKRRARFGWAWEDLPAPPWAGPGNLFVTSAGYVLHPCVSTAAAVRWKIDSPDRQ